MLQQQAHQKSRRIKMVEVCLLFMLRVYHRLSSDSSQYYICFDSEIECDRVTVNTEVIMTVEKQNRVKHTLAPKSITWK